jgi:transcriptional regulatory protein LevR/transcriptional regulator with AAA-type ATPase domain
MSRKDKIFQCVCKLVKVQDVKIGVDSVTISEELGIDRSNVSRDLNELVREGRLKKIGGRPVYFIETSQYEELLEKEKKRKSEEEEKRFEFDFMVGQNGSLKEAIKQGKSAMMYPPRGLHTLLSGPTGTGKTTFAEKLYEYAVKIGCIDIQKEFIVFNCAEYAQNPQLILSQLFGHRKGAFTGALNDKKGLVEKADGGILFLDEIHRLPPEGQEMLFLLMDKGIYRRLGETEEFRKASVLIIGATTENVNTSLLKTFLRRMPVVIHLPALKDRPLVERLQLIETFFTNEQKKIGAPIRVYKEVIIVLLLYRCTGNIGQLQADIQLLCAQAFLQYKVKGLEAVTVDLNVLPEYIQNGRLEYQKKKNDLIEFLRYSDDYHIFEEEKSENEDKNSLYDIISRKYQLFKNSGRSERQITGILQEDLNDYMKQLMEKYQVSDEKDGTKNLLKIIDSKVYYAVEEVISFAEVKLNRKLTDQAKIGMAMHVNAMVERINKGIPLREEDMKSVVLNHPKEFRVAKIILRLLEEELNIEIPKQELGYLTMFLCVQEESTEIKNIGVIVLSHGNSTASSMAEVVNQLLDTKHCRAIDMPLDVSVEATLEKSKEMVQEADEGKGVLLLVDMGSLTMFANLIEETMQIKVSMVPMVSTAIAIEAVRKSMMKGTKLEELAQDLKALGKILLGEEKNNFLDSPKNIITTCFTGQGTAVKIKEIILEMLSESQKKNLSIQCMDFKEASDVKEGIKEVRQQKITAVVGTVDLQLDEVPFISVDELIIGAGMQRLEQLIGVDNAAIESLDVTDEQEYVSSNVLIETLKGMLGFLNPEKIVPLLSESFFSVTKKNHWKLGKEVYVRYMIHTACMLERTLQGETLPHKQTEMLQKEYEAEFLYMKGAFCEIEQMLHIKIENSEIAYLVEMLLDLH